MIYLDNSATTPVDPRVLEAMLPYLKEEYGNPSAKYYTLAQNAKNAVDNSRAQVAQLINCEPDEIIFTSGASESNNFILKGIADANRFKGNHIITSVIEHKSVLETCRYLERQGFKVTYLPVDNFGQVSPEDLEKSITASTILVSIMWGNNEIGTLNKIDLLSNICLKKDVLFHSDATQVLGKLTIDMHNVPVDFLSFSAHKLYGPKGVGGCFLRKDKHGLKRVITPLIHGGEQEFEYRAGTLSTHNIVGFGKAAEIANNEMLEYIQKILITEKQLKEILYNEFEDIVFNGHPSERIPGLLSVTFPGINNEILVKKLQGKIAISTGSACSINKPSHVLSSLEIKLREIRNTVRISLGKFYCDLSGFQDILKDALR